MYCTGIAKAALYFNKLKFTQLTKCVLLYYNLIDFLFIHFTVAGYPMLPSSEHFYDQTISGKLIAIGKPFTVAGVLSLKVGITWLFRLDVSRSFEFTHTIL